MPYTLADWIRDNAQVIVVLPGIDGQVAIPLGVLTGDGGYYPEYYSYRVQSDNEAEELQRWQRAEEGG